MSIETCPHCNEGFRTGGKPQNAKRFRKHVDRCEDEQRAQMERDTTEEAQAEIENLLYEALSPEFTLQQQECIITALKILTNPEGY